MVSGLWWHPSRAALLAVAGLFMLSTQTCGAAEEQFWPELDGYFKVNDETRLFLMGSLTRAEDADVQSGSPRYENGKLGAHVDISLQPVLRVEFADKDWERNRYLWMRIGYNYVGNYHADGTYHEDRGILELSVRQPLSGKFWLTGRLKWDLRDIDGSYSNRYRMRLGTERRLAPGGRSVVPYVHAELYYDTRFDTWNRQRYQAGIAINDRWKIEPYLAHQNDSRSTPAHLNALSLVLKYSR